MNQFKNNSSEAQNYTLPILDIDMWKCKNCGHSLEYQELLGDNVLLHGQYDYCPKCGRKVDWSVCMK